MKIAILVPASLPATQFGGILFLAVDIARELSSAGNDVTIYTTDMDFANNPKTFNKNLPQIEKIENFKIKRSHVWFSYGLFFVNPKMYNQIISDKPDLIHTIGIRSFQSLIAAIITKNKKIPLIISDQGGLTTHPDLSKNNIIRKMFYFIQKPMIRFIINQSTAIIVANNYEKNIFKKFINESKIRIVNNGINLNDFLHVKINFRKKYQIINPYILFVGRFNKVKGVDTLIHAFSLINNENKSANLKLVIMGVDFGFQNEMIQMIKNFELEKKVVVIKNPPREDVIAAYSECEFLVLPSRWELSPLTPLEGFAFKKTVISTTAHGIPSTITHEENGMLVEPDNPKKLSESIIELLKNKEKREKMGESGFKLVQDVCNSASMARNTYSIYREFLSE